MFTQSPILIDLEAHAPSSSFLHSFNKHALCQALWTKDIKTVPLTLRTTIICAAPFSNWLQFPGPAPLKPYRTQPQVLSPYSLTIPTKLEKEGWVKNSLWAITDNGQEEKSAEVVWYKGKAMSFGVRDLGSDPWINRVTLRKSFNFFGPQFPHL